VDAGHGALSGKLRRDDRVVNLEKTNIGDLAPGDLDPLPHLATVDLSYLSLRKAIPIVMRLLQPDGEMLCLVKPLFEVQDPHARRSGKIADPDAYRQVLADLKQFVEDLGLGVRGITHSHIRGNRGTVEFWMHISNQVDAGEETIDINGSVEAASALPDWKKGERQDRGA
jgi:23S rRNA (cytidine1920-2'-O)/16S rRNA (cytidine1409-2'-O)-methyltransferase